MNANKLQVKEQKVENPEQLMIEYKQTGNKEYRNQLVMHYLQYVNVAIYSMRSILLSNIPFEDFFNEGIIALMDCIERYDPDRGVATFDTYSYMGIRGAILKYHRKQNWLPNRLWSARKDIANAKNILEQQLLREPHSSEIAEYLGITEDKLASYIKEMAVINTVSFEELLSEAYGNLVYKLSEIDSQSPDHNLLVEEMRNSLARAIDKLPIKEKQIISLYYYEGMNLREIGEILSISQQRVSQLRKKALEKLKVALAEED